MSENGPTLARRQLGKYLRDGREGCGLKSSRSGGDKECVEVAFLSSNLVGVRDSKNRSGPALTFTSAEWSAFTAAATRGEFDA